MMPQIQASGPQEDVSRPPQAENNPEKNGSNHSVREDEIPACQSCRKRKLKCSRESPSCSQCTRLGCTCQYERRDKPGVKSGAIEALNRRLEVLEKILLDGEGNQKRSENEQGCIYHASILLAKELQPQTGLLGRALSGNHDARESLQCCRDSDSIAKDTTEPLENEGPSRKRKRGGSRNGGQTPTDGNEAPSSLPSDEILSTTIDVFFSSTHHWIPFLHPFRFRRDIEDPHKRTKLELILHAIVYASMHRLDLDNLNIEQSDIDRQVELSRNTVILNALGSLTIENVQALIIVASTAIISGQVCKAWSIIGSLTRTVEYLQLTVEPDTLQRGSLSAPLSLLDSPADWTESEDRRRVFWNVFLLDRFCSITTGWSTSLTSDDVQRRLPCDGELWHKETPALTPYFGIWNKAAAKIGNSVAYIPAHYPTSEHETDHRSPTAISCVGPVDTSKLGAFAYCIEATESLSQVTSFFLQQRVNFRDASEFSSWLTRFKELDLRLVHWKMFLPQKWKDSNVSRDTALINMDPNLTLAHITHNTSMILLHQHIAYPPPDWDGLVKLPSSCSADTCQSAAIETASIGQKYLKHTEIGILSSQFALCNFVAARILLVHWRFFNTPLLPEYFILLENLERMSELCRGATNSSEHDATLPSNLDLAGKYLLHLQCLHQKCSGLPNFRLDPNYGGLLPPLAIPPPLAVTSPSPRPRSTAPNYLRQLSQSGQSPRDGANTFGHMYGTSTAVPFTTQSPTSAISPRSQAHVRRPTGLSPTWYANVNNAEDRSVELQSMHQEVNGHTSHDTAELLAVSNQLMDQEFLDMDRVITLDDMDFALGFDLWNYA
ncbi:fungal-specific transcription factor domain-containing protein [Hyaloscypha finlandica]|nr:fungal-specific transcription factor domain-containing protein [Hyaloscypha finlandica]